MKADCGTMLFALPPRVMFSLVCFSLLSLNAMAMEIIATDDQSSTGPEYELNINFPMSEKSYRVDHLTDRSTITVRFFF